MVLKVVAAMVHNLAVSMVQQSVGLTVDEKEWRTEQPMVE